MNELKPDDRLFQICHNFIVKGFQLSVKPFLIESCDMLVTSLLLYTLMNRFKFLSNLTEYDPVVNFPIRFWIASVFKRKSVGFKVK